MSQMQKTLGPAAIGIRGLPLPEAIELARATGFDAVVFDVAEASRLADEHGRDHVRDLFARANVRPGSWNAPVPWRQGSDAEIAAALGRLPVLAALARDLGAIRATSGIWPGSDESSYDDNFAWTVERLRPVAQALADEGCR